MSETPGPRVFDVPIALRWSDMDALLHLNNAAAFTVLEEARLRMLFAMGGGLVDGPSGLVVGRQEVDYLRPVLYRPEPVTVRLWIERIGTASFTIRSEILDADGEAAVSARTVAVSVRRDGPGSQPLAEESRAVLEQYLHD